MAGTWEEAEGSQQTNGRPKLHNSKYGLEALVTVRA